MKVNKKGQLRCKCDKLLDKSTIDLGRCIQVNWNCERCGREYTSDAYITDNIFLRDSPPPVEFRGYTIVQAEAGHQGIYASVLRPNDTALVIEGRTLSVKGDTWEQAVENTKRKLEEYLEENSW